MNRHLLMIDVVSPEAGKLAEASSDLPLVYTAKGTKRRRIQGMDLSAYKSPEIPKNRNIVWRAAWYLVNDFLFQGAILSLIPSSWKAAILRGFGATVGKCLICKPRVNIKYPWLLELRAHVWLDNEASIDNQCSVQIGSHACIRQLEFVITGSHSWDDYDFAFSCRGTDIDDCSWIAAGTLLGLGSIIDRGTVVVSRSWPFES